GTRAGGAVARAALDPSECAPLPAYGTRLRAIGFVDDYCARRLVIELLDELARARGAHLLSLHASSALGRVITWLAYIARGTGERLRERLRSLVGGVSHLALRFAKQLIRAALQALPAPRASGLAGLRVVDIYQGLVAPPSDGLYPAPAHQEDLHAVRGGNQGIHPQVHADDRLLGTWDISDFTDETHDPIRQADFHQAPRQHGGIRQAKARAATRAVRHHQPPFTDTHLLVGVHHVVIVRPAPRIARCCLAGLAQLAARVHRLAALTDELLGRSSGQTRIAPLSPLLPTRFLRPLPAQAADAV